MLAESSGMQAPPIQQLCLRVQNGCSLPSHHSLIPLSVKEEGVKNELPPSYEDTFQELHTQLLLTSHQMSATESYHHT